MQLHLRSKFLGAHVLATLVAIPLLQWRPLSPAYAAPLKEGEIFIDAVVASVDEKPITLSELNDRFLPPRKLSFTEVSRDVEAVKLLEALIIEKLLEEEAASKRLSATDAEVEEYIEEVARRNKLARGDFERELVSEGGNLTAYKRQVRSDILRTKLASSFTRGGVSISDSEIDEYIEKHPELSRNGPSLKLRQILVSATDRSAEELTQRIEAAQQQLEKGTEFAEVAKQYSDGPQSQEGGLIGIVAETDLSSDVSEAVAELKDGEVSKPIQNELGIQLFKVEQRFSKDDDDDSPSAGFREEVRKTLLQAKTQEKLSSYFVTELYKNHAVDKKL